MIHINDFTNQNGLVDGKIPTGCACPFHVGCKLKSSNCPVSEKLNDQPFSCAAARAFSLMLISGE